MKRPMTVSEAAQTLDAVRPLMESQGLRALQFYFDDQVENLTEAVFYDAEMHNADAVKIRACVRNAVKKNWQPAKLAAALIKKCESTLENAKNQADNAQPDSLSES